MTDFLSVSWVYQNSQGDSHIKRMGLLVPFKVKNTVSVPLKVPMKRKFFQYNFKIKRLRYTIPKFEMPMIKIVDFTRAQN